MPLAPQITNTPDDIGGVDYAITAVTYTSSTATYTATGHTFNVGDIVTVSGITPDGYNGTYTITSIVASTSFTVANTTNAVVTVATGDAYMAPSTDYTFDASSVAYIPNSEDVLTLGSATTAIANTALANAATAIANAATANATANSAAYTAGVAQTSANGKNTTHYSTAAASGGGVTGDIWFKVDGSGYVLNQYVYNGSSWISAPITNTVIASLDAGKINGGTITGIAYNNGSGTFSVSAAGALVASSATITGTINATTGSFTGSVYATTGNVGGWALSSSQLSSGGSYLDSGGNVVLSGTLSAVGSISGGSFTSNNQLVVSGNSTLSGLVYYTGHGTTGSSANAYINSSTGLIARSTSSLRYKVDVTPQTIPTQSILALTPKSFYDKGAVTEQDGDTTGLPRILGLIAEEVAQIPVLADLLMNKNKKGDPDSVNYDRVAVALLPLLKDHEDRLASLEARVNALENR